MNELSKGECKSSRPIESTNMQAATSYDLPFYNSKQGKNNATNGLEECKMGFNYANKPSTANDVRGGGGRQRHRLNKIRKEMTTNHSIAGHPAKSAFSYDMRQNRKRHSVVAEGVRDPSEHLYHTKASMQSFLTQPCAPKLNLEVRK